MFKKSVLTGAALLLIGCLTACGATANSQPAGGQSAGGPAQSQPVAAAKTEVVIAIDSEPESGFDPTVGWGHGATPLIQSTLVAYTPDRQFENDLATGYTLSDDGLEWRFTLRQDAFFTDGTPVTAADVAFTFVTAKASRSTLDLTGLLSCEAVGDTEVVFTLAKPASTFLHTLATIGIVPQHAYDENYGSAPIGSGPWKLVQWHRGERVILEANEDYYGTAPAIKKATLVFMDETAAFAAAQAGQVDVALTSATLATQAISGMRLQAVTTLDNRGITLPTTPATGQTTDSGHPVGNNVTCHLAIRQALATGIDRAQIAQDALNGYADPAYSENDGMPWNNPAVQIETDAEKARQLLADAGWADTDGDGVVEKGGLQAAFTCIYPAGDSVRQAVAMAAAQQARALGIAITVEGVSWNELSQRMFSDAVLMGWGSSNPMTSYYLYHSTGALQDDYYNPEGYQNPTADAYLDAALNATTPEAANAQWQLAQWNGETGTAMQGDCPWVWLVNVQHLYYVRGGLDIGAQQLHPHGASWPLLQNLEDWTWS